MDPLPLIDELLHLLASFTPPKDKQVFVGLDGYIDRIQKVVQTQEEEQNSYFSTIPELASRISLAAGKSAQLELVNQTVKPGGNAPIMAHALGTLGIPNYCLGSFGEDTIHPVFQSMSDHCTLLSLGKPAETNALEFDDGKLILSEVSAFSQLDWSYVKEIYSAEQLLRFMKDCSIIALVDWCNLPRATDIWQGILHEILPKLSHGQNRQFFFDLADPTKKSESEIGRIISTMQAYRQYGNVTLGLNENEAYRLAQVLFQQEGSETMPTALQLNEICSFIFEKLRIDCLLVHPLDRSVIVTKEGLYEVPGKLAQKLLISTGGGDNLNAGFCLALLAGSSLQAATLLGMATSGAYVRDGQSPSRSRLLAYLEEWKAALA
ncbi:sugar/nucleoside kinase (ribokinase family) [Catalinimonas alkaloidigena]|uniref:hypothetical protein n=1 Tax=Catalinimonas alkaloidigena TaxID=1075417 RepID=UPI002406C908|nr:hypothetical protein [Catalinimonas alkaloidigena]MDF9800600.1 sugar/nucleoside kinase (ribokinase family) [Catalinimonas alkaloidigena]